MTLDEIINALLNYYIENGSNATMEYTYGYLDAVAAVRELQRNA